MSHLAIFKFQMLMRIMRVMDEMFITVIHPMVNLGCLIIFMGAVSEDRGELQPSGVWIFNACQASTNSPRC